MKTAATSSTNRFATPPFSALAFIIAAATAPAGCMLAVEVEAPDVEVTRQDITFDGVPTIPGYEEVSVLYSFDQKQPDLALPSEVTSSLAAVMVELRAKSGVQDLDFLRTLRVTMRDKTGAMTPVVLFDYVRDDSKKVGKTLQSPGKNPTNILEQWRDKDVAVFDVLVSGKLPNQAWKVDLAIHFAGSAKYRY